MKSLILLVATFVSSLALADIGEPIGHIPMQDSGRIKPFDTFARESLQLIYGKKSFEKKSAAEVVFTWMLIPDHWLDTPIVEVRHSGLKEALKITSTEKYFTPKSLFANDRLPLIMQELANLRTRQEKLNPYYQAVQRLESQLGLFQAVRTGVAFRFVPDAESDTWKSLENFDEEMKDAFAQVSKGFVDSISAATEGKRPVASAEYKQAVDDFISKARAKAPEKYANLKKISWEEHLNKFHPFRWAWVAYLFGLIFLTIRGVKNSDWPIKPAWAFLILGLLLHAYGMAVRSYLSGRPPVTNMYETVVWAAFGSVLFAFFMARKQKNGLLLGAAATVAIFCLILTDLAPTVLDASIHPLQPVLRSTFWLTTHVLIITISYANFFLAFVLGDILLYYFLKDENRYAAQIQSGVHSIYRSIQIGVVLLAAGTILGGIWADYSWGRFWGWDPKETWALISLLGYLAILHGRLVGWVKNFELAATSVVAFSLVIMAWYGVNFALGAGLHTYGFGAGGVEYVTGFVVIHLLFVAYVSTVRYGRLKKPTK